MWVKCINEAGHSDLTALEVYEVEKIIINAIDPNLYCINGLKYPDTLFEILREDI